MSAIRDKVLNGIVEQGSVGAGYAQAARDSASQVARAVTHGQRPDAALRELGIAKPFDLIHQPDLLAHLNERILHVIVGGGDVHDVPSAECVGEKLRGKANPTREDVERAFEECRRAGR